MPIYDFECENCEIVFDQIVTSTKVKGVACPKCGDKAGKIFPTKAPRFSLTYDPKSDMVDWDGNKSQYYRLYDEAKSRGENVRLPEEGE